MSHTLKVPAVMRVFKPLPVDALCLGDTYSCMDEGEILKVTTVCIATYDHNAKLAIQFVLGSVFYLLVEELCDESEDLAYQWRGLYESLVFAKTDEERKDAEQKIEALYEKFRPIMRKYFRPELQVVRSGENTALLSNATSIRPVPLLHV